MGTNVYVLREEPVSQEGWKNLKDIASEQDIELLDKWIRDYSEFTDKNTIHIGKRSCGWKFQFNHNNWKYYDYTLESIIEFLQSCYKIYDERKEISVEEFIKDYVLSNSKGMDGESYAMHELNRAHLKASGHPDYQSQFIMSVDEANRYYYDYKRHNWYEERSCNGQEIPRGLPYYFSDSTEFS
jgi:hypothetical protein